MGKSVALVALATAGVALAGCQSGTTNTPDPVVATTADQSGSAGSTPATPAGKATIGSTITLAGNDPGAQVAVTVVTVANPAKGASDYITPKAGNKYVAVQVRLRNTGRAGYDDSPSNGAKVVDVQGQQYEATTDDITAGPSLPADTKIAPGGMVLGFLVFEVPATVRLSGFQFTLDSGFADQTGEWTLA